MILKIQNLEASVNNKIILKNFHLEIKSNEIHVIMGPNGSGKSTFSKVLAGHPAYSVTQGEILYDGKNFLEFPPEKRSHEGFFLAFQYPLEISGVSNYDFLRLAYNQKQKYLGKKEVTPLEFMGVVQKKLEQLKMPKDLLNRDINQGFSGGEKKRNEILQMLLLEPKLIVLDELDSGLDIDGLKLICDTISKEFLKKSSLLLITHYPRILNYLTPHYIHIMKDGKILKTGNMELVEQLEKHGYDIFEKS